MKNITKTLFILALMLISILSFGQSLPTYDGKYLTSNIKDGFSITHEMKFHLSKEDYESIKSSELFTQWKKENIDPSPDVYKSFDLVVLYLTGQIVGSNVRLKMVLKNSKSLEFVEGTKGMIYLSESGFNISYPFKAQNDYGNSIPGDFVYNVEIKDGKKVTEVFIL